MSVTTIVPMKKYKEIAWRKIYDLFSFLYCLVSHFLKNFSNIPQVLLLDKRGWPFEQCWIACVVAIENPLGFNAIQAELEKMLYTEYINPTKTSMSLEQEKLLTLTREPELHSLQLVYHIKTRLERCLERKLVVLIKL